MIEIRNTWNCRIILVAIYCNLQIFLNSVYFFQYIYIHKVYSITIYVTVIEILTLMIMVIFMRYFSREHMALSLKNNKRCEHRIRKNEQIKIIIIIMVIFKCYFSGELIALT